jgi:hypothetical protein
MSWLSEGKGIFKLHDSDSYCDLLISEDDVAEILEVPTRYLNTLSALTLDGTKYLDELEVHRALGRKAIPTELTSRNIPVSFDELILRKLIQLALPRATIEQ